MPMNDSSHRSALRCALVTVALGSTLLGLCACGAKTSPKTPSATTPSDAPASTAATAKGNAETVATTTTDSSPYTSTATPPAASTPSSDPTGTTDAGRGKDAAPGTTPPIQPQRPPPATPAVKPAVSVEGLNAAGGVISVDGPVYSWGEAYQGQVFEHTFEITNPGKVPVRITEVKPKCGCTVARNQVEDHTLQPGQKVSVTLQVDTTGFSSFTRKEADIVCVGDVDGDTKLWMEGDVKKLFTRTPHNVVIDVVRDATAASRSFQKTRLVSGIESTVAIRKVVSIDGIVTAGIVETKPGNTFELTLRPTIDLTQKVVLQKDKLVLTVVINDEEIEVRFPVSIKVKERVQVLPSKSVYFSSSLTKRLGEPGSALPRKTLEVKSFGGGSHRFSITEVTMASGETSRFKVTLLPETITGRSSKLAIELRPPTRASETIPLVKDRLILRTDDPEVPELIIPCTARFGRRR